MMNQIVTKTHHQYQRMKKKMILGVIVKQIPSEILKQDLHTPVKEWKQLQVGHIFYDPKTAWSM